VQFLMSVEMREPSEHSPRDAPDFFEMDPDSYLASEILAVNQLHRVVGVT
jgi:hypothetical protein